MLGIVLYSSSLGDVTYEWTFPKICSEPQPLSRMTYDLKRTSASGPAVTKCSPARAWTVKKAAKKAGRRI